MDVLNIEMSDDLIPFEPLPFYDENAKPVMNERLLEILDYREQDYPHALEKQYPRVLSKILDLWEHPDVEKYFSDLMFTDDHDRQGFPPEVAADIMCLIAAHSRRKPKKEDAWDQIFEMPKEPFEIARLDPKIARQQINKLGLPYSPEGLIKACETGNTVAVSLYIGAGMNINTCDEIQWTPVLIASYYGYEEMADMLIHCGADIYHQDAGGYTPLHWAAFNGFPTIVKMLLENKANVDARSNYGWTPLLQAASRGHLTVSLLLIEYGADINAASKDGWTPLHKAAANGHLAVVKLLVHRKVNINAKYNDGTTALDLAKKDKREQIVAALSEINYS